MKNLIRKEIKSDGTFGGNYPYELDYSILPEKYIEITEEQQDFIDSNINKLRYDETQDGIWENIRGVIDISQTPEYIAIELEAAKKIKLAENEKNYNARLKSGVIYNGVKYDCDDRACLRVSGQSIKNLKSPIDIIEWFDYYFQSQSLTTDEFNELEDAIIQINRAIETRNCYINAQVENVQSLEELNLINIDYNDI